MIYGTIRIQWRPSVQRSLGAHSIDWWMVGMQWFDQMVDGMQWFDQMVDGMQWFDHMAMKGTIVALSDMQ